MLEGEPIFRMEDLPHRTTLVIEPPRRQKGEANTDGNEKDNKGWGEVGYDRKESSDACQKTLHTFPYTGRRSVERLKNRLGKTGGWEGIGEFLKHQRNAGRPFPLIPTGGTHLKVGGHLLRKRQVVR